MNARLREQLLPTDVAALDAQQDALLRFENAERYTAQSAATVAGQPAPLPDRPSLQLVKGGAA